MTVRRGTAFEGQNGRPENRVDGDCVRPDGRSSTYSPRGSPSTAARTDAGQWDHAGAGMPPVNLAGLMWQVRRSLVPPGGDERRAHRGEVFLEDPENPLSLRAQ